MYPTLFYYLLVDPCLQHQMMDQYTYAELGNKIFLILKLIA